MKQWRHLFRDIILERGISYYRSNKVSKIEKDRNCYHAVVKGEQNYDVRILMRDDRILDAYCDCPYYVKGELCKHIAATLLKIEKLEK